MPFAVEHSEYFVGEKEISLVTEFFSSPTIKLSYWKMENIFKTKTPAVHAIFTIFWHSSIFNKAEGL